MPLRNAAASYRDQAVRTAPGPQILLMLYDRLLADLATAERAVADADHHGANEALQHAQQIVRMLRTSLRPDGFDGGHELLALYHFVEERLVAANMAKDAGMIRECAELLSPLRDAWHAAVNAEGGGRGDAVSGVA